MLEQLVASGRGLVLRMATWTSETEVWRALASAARGSSGEPMRALVWHGRFCDLSCVSASISFTLSVASRKPGRGHS
jgi:hypothetical protein